MRTVICEIPFDSVTLEQAVAALASYCDGQGFHHITTPNPEMVVLAARDQQFRSVLQRADLSVADGIGIVFASYLSKGKLPSRVSGTDLVDALMAWAEVHNRSVFFLGGREEGVAQQASENMRTAYPHLRVVGAISGGEMSRRDDGSWNMDPNLLSLVNAAAPDILLVAMNHGKQEKWIFDHRHLLSSVRVAIGVGGAFNFFARKIPRAPKVMRVFGFEWFWRLMQEPRRWRRILTAVVIFPYLVLKEKIGNI